MTERDAGRTISDLPHGGTGGAGALVHGDWLHRAKSAVANLPSGFAGGSHDFLREAEKVAGPSPYPQPTHLIVSCLTDGVIQRTGRIAVHKYRRHGKAITHNGPEYVRPGAPDPIVQTVVEKMYAEPETPKANGHFTPERMDYLEHRLAEIKDQIKAMRDAFDRHFK